VTRAVLAAAFVLALGCAPREAPPKPCNCAAPVAPPLPTTSAPAMPKAAPTPAPASAALPSYSLEGTEVHELASKITGKNYKLIVGPPYKPEPGRRYATLYVLDGYWDFILIEALRGALHYDQAIPDVLVVGVAYAGEKPDVDSLRASDYTPTRDESRPDSGKGPEFLRFFEQELFPFVEARYPSDPEHRVVSGASFGGLFTLYALFEKPELFYGYVSMAPAARWDNGWLARREREFRAGHPALAKRVWVSAASDEDPAKLPAMRDFIKQFEASRYQDLALRTRLIEGERHAAMKVESYNRGLRWVLAPIAPKPSK
jgi:predicted alpha/beta superfamily hydrolase